MKMNNKIREIADQVSWQCQDVTYGELEKFAEFLLEDVLLIVGNGGEFCSRPKLIEQLKTHFGVGE